VNPKLIDFDEADYAWSSGDISGVLFSLPSTDINIDEWSKEFLGGLASECEGTFGSQLTATIPLGNKRIKQFYAACKGSNEELFIVATAVDMDSGILFLMNFTSIEPVILRNINDNLAEMFVVLFKE